MKPQIKLAETLTPDGGTMALFEHDGSYAIRVNGQGLMDSRATESERMLGELGTARVTHKPDARILIGGLGLGFTLKSVLESAHPKAIVHVAELMPEVIAWNRDHLSSLNGKLIDDPRVAIYTEDVFGMIMRSKSKYDSILLDIDNGPSPMVQGANDKLYGDMGVYAIAGALRPGGRAVIWSAAEDKSFAKRLHQAGFTVEEVRAKRYPGAKRAAILLYVADKAK